MSDRSPAQRKDTARIRRDTARLRPRESQRDTGRVQVAPDLRFNTVVFAPRLELNGITMYARTLLNTLRARGDQLMLVSPGGPLAQTMTGAHDHKFELPGERAGYFAWRRLKESLAEFEPDMLHAVSPSGSEVAVRVADHLQIPLVVSVHGVKPAELPDPGDKQFDAYIASDQSVRERLLNDCRLERDRTTLINDCAFPESPPDEQAILNSRRRQVIGWVSPLVPGCGYSTFIDAAMKVQARGLDSMFTILGSGPVANDVRNEVEARGMLPRIVVIEGLFEYGRLWDPFDIAVIDSRQQASALMVLNAMANGRPVIATEGGAVFELIEDGVDGMIVPRNDADALAERIQMLVQNPAERLRMAKAAFARVEEEYRPADMAAEIAEVYAALLQDEPLPKPRKSARTGAQ